MKLVSIWVRYKEYTEELSKNFRTLGLGAAAICWFFKTDDIQFPPLIYTSLIFVAFFFLADIGHYSIGAFRIKVWAEKKEKELIKSGVPLNEKTEVDQPASLDTWPFRLFLAKAALLAIAYALIVAELASKIKMP